jgi:hypothetical protein
MKIRNSTELRDWAGANGFADSWWYSVNGTVSGKSEKLSKIPKEGTVHILNADSRETDSEEWFCFRYSGYKTAEEVGEELDRKRQATQLTKKQKVALEFMGHPTAGLSKGEASRLLDIGFDSLGFDTQAFESFKWERRQEAYSLAEILSILFERAQFIDGILRDQIADEKKRFAVEEAISAGVNEGSFIPYLRAKHPEFFVTDATRRRKQNAHQQRSELWEGFSEHGEPEERIAVPRISKRQIRASVDHRSTSESRTKPAAFSSTAIAVAITLGLAILAFLLLAARAS